MKFHDAANFLYDLRRFGPRPGIESTADLLAALDDPHEELDCVQIAGSNGKGSTARMTESILREAGLTVGLFTSPHLEDLRERIRVDGRKIPKRAVCEFVDRVEGHVRDRGAEGISPTFFEATTAMALWQFAREEVDIVVLEVGIGGKKDATSVVDPIASAVTSVTLEHTDVLGDTIEEIARDKAHVAPADAPLVTGVDGTALDAVRSIAGEVVTVGAGGDVVPTYGGRTNHTEAAVGIEGPDWSVDTRIPTLGAHQSENAAIAATLARQVADERGEELSEASIGTGLRRSHWPGRFEVVDQAPLTVLDGAHNPGACERIAEVLAEFEYDDLHLVFGAMHDKDHRAMAAALPSADRVVACQPDLDRAEDEAVLARVFEASGADEVVTNNSVEGALSRALREADADDCVLVTGSLFTVAEARTRWTRLQVPKRVEEIDDARAVLSDAHVTDPGVWRMRGKGVHRVLKTRVQKRQAQYLKEELLSLGGECALSGLNDQDDVIIDVVMMATMAQFNRLVDKLEGQPYGLSVVGEEIRETLGIRTGDPESGYPWDDGTAVMGILNITPDSFHDGGEYNAVDAARERAERMVANGAEILDVGGESTRPGADPVSVEEEIDRVVPVIEAIADLDATISVDTRKAAVARAAVEAGADIINDVSGLEDPEMRLVAAEYDVPVVVMHSIHTPVDPDAEIAYDDVVGDTLAALEERVLLAEKAGLDRSQVIVDPGLGFGKTATESFELLGRLSEFRSLGCPVLVGHSRKSMFGLVGREDADDRLAATVAATALAAERGADIVRVHDVAENLAAVRTAAAAEDPSRFDG